MWRIRLYSHSTVYLACSSEARLPLFVRHLTVAPPRIQHMGFSERRRIKLIEGTALSKNSHLKIIKTNHPLFLLFYVIHPFLRQTSLRAGCSSGIGSLELKRRTREGLKPKLNIKSYVACIFNISREIHFPAMKIPC